MSLKLDGPHSSEITPSLVDTKNNIVHLKGLDQFEREEAVTLTVA